MLTSELPFLNDPEGDYLPQGLPRVIDAHVHIFPDKIFSAVRNWFDAHAWKIRYQANSADVISFLLNHGVSQVVALQYAHKPGIAGGLNRYMIEICQKFPGRVLGMATVFPGERQAVRILEQAFEAGLCGVKLHAHVQCFDMGQKQMTPLYAVCAREKKPMILHVGREPKSDHYLCDPYEICRADKLEAVLKAFPTLKICVPHLGFDEILSYKALIEKYETLWLDTAMVLTDYFPKGNRVGLETYRMDRIMYGSDFPNIPYAWDRELMWLKNSSLSRSELEQVLYTNVKTFLGMDPLVY
ncbi:MAG: amidohydrolase [Proteobacteria bacterium]|nr:amidohydrolase family protein [Desulfobacula sp.]MBU4132159.1 amidohydrolase [Pseudomonadota bacterium]